MKPIEQYINTRIAFFTGTYHTGLLTEVCGDKATITEVDGKYTIKTSVDNIIGTVE